MPSSSTAIWVRSPVWRTTMTRSTLSRRARNSDSVRIGDTATALLAALAAALLLGLEAGRAAQRGDLVARAERAAWLAHPDDGVGRVVGGDVLGAPAPPPPLLRRRRRRRRWVPPSPSASPSASSSVGWPSVGLVRGSVLAGSGAVGLAGSSPSSPSPADPRRPRPPRRRRRRAGRVVVLGVARPRRRGRARPAGAASASSSAGGAREPSSVLVGASSATTRLEVRRLEERRRSVSRLAGSSGRGRVLRARRRRRRWPSCGYVGLGQRRRPRPRRPGRSVGCGSVGAATWRLCGGLGPAAPSAGRRVPGSRSARSGVVVGGRGAAAGWPAGGRPRAAGPAGRLAAPAAPGSQRPGCWPSACRMAASGWSDARAGRGSRCRASRCSSWSPRACTVAGPPRAAGESRCATCVRESEGIGARSGPARGQGVGDSAADHVQRPLRQPGHQRWDRRREVGHKAQRAEHVVGSNGRCHVPHDQSQYRTRPAPTTFAAPEPSARADAERPPRPATPRRPGRRTPGCRSWSAARRPPRRAPGRPPRRRRPTSAETPASSMRHSDASSRSTSEPRASSPASTTATTSRPGRQGLVEGSSHAARGRSAG